MHYIYEHVLDNTLNRRGHEKLLISGKSYFYFFYKVYILTLAELKYFMSQDLYKHFKT